MHSIPLQLDLFPYSSLIQPAASPSLGDEERDRRSPGQWLRAVRAYLEFRAGDAWRRSGDRNSPERLYYLDGLRLLNGLGTDSQFGPASVSLTPRSAEDVPIAALASRPRGELVANLMRADPALTDRKLLSHLQNSKLARMLIRAESHSAMRLERTA